MPHRQTVAVMGVLNVAEVPVPSMELSVPDPAIMVETPPGVVTCRILLAS
jgi:hypothetical protein